uniref:Uncharacterized protein n=1 Tax=Anguilla anguilla TaxID=7936 RepID=A0A0E9UCC6_ANGAN
MNSTCKSFICTLYTRVLQLQLPAGQLPNAAYGHNTPIGLLVNLLMVRGTVCRHFEDADLNSNNLSCICISFSVFKGTR